MNEKLLFKLKHFNDTYHLPCALLEKIENIFL